MIVDRTRILAPWSKYLCGRERSNRLAAMDDETYKQFLLQHKHYSAIVPDIYPMGAWFMKPGAYEDFLRYIANEHHVLGGMLADHLHPFSRLERATSFLILHSFVFLLTAAYSNLDATAYFIISIIIISPFSIVLEKLLYLLLAMPCGRMCCCYEFMKCMGKCITGFLFIVGIFLFWISAVIVSNAFPSPAHQRLICWNYLYTLFIVSAAEELFLMYLYFVDIDSLSLFRTLDCLTCRFLKIGVWGKELIAYEQDHKVVYVDFETASTETATSSPNTPSSGKVSIENPMAN